MWMKPKNSNSITVCANINRQDHIKEQTEDWITAVNNQVSTLLGCEFSILYKKKYFHHGWEVGMSQPQSHFILPNCQRWNSEELLKFILGHLGAVEQAKNVKLMYYHLTANVLANSYLFTHPADREQHKHSFEVTFLLWCSPTPQGNVWHFRCKILHFVHQFVSNFVRLPFGVGEVVYSGFVRAFLLKTASCCSWKQLEWERSCGPEHQNNEGAKEVRKLKAGAKRELQRWTCKKYWLLQISLWMGVGCVPITWNIQIF